MSSRAIAEATGIPRRTIDRARDGSNGPPDKRVGLDGKARRQVQSRGVPQDYVTAHKWFDLAAAGGNKAGGQI
jgi:TPR repeat protein